MRKKIFRLIEIINENSILIALLGFPFVILNLSSLIVGCIWVAFHGLWLLVVGSIIFAFSFHRTYLFITTPTFLWGVYAAKRYLQSKNITLLYITKLIIEFIELMIRLLVIVFVIYILLIIKSDYDLPLIPIFLIGYALIMYPFQALIMTDKQKNYDVSDSVYLINIFINYVLLIIGFVNLNTIIADIIKVLFVMNNLLYLVLQILYTKNVIEEMKISANRSEEDTEFTNMSCKSDETVNVKSTNSNAV
ncbi:MAG: hypothetical protein PHW02_00010 [bacterium]|nr:hypothetical protein [bacterium]